MKIKTYVYSQHNDNMFLLCDAMKEMNRGIRSFFLFTIYTIQLWNRVRFCFFKSFTERRRCHTNNTYIQRVNIYTLLTQNHYSDVILEGHLIFRDFIEFKRKNTGTSRSTWLTKTTTSVKIYIDHFNKEIYFRSRKRRNHFEDKQCQTVIRKDRGRWVFSKLWEKVI